MKPESLNPLSPSPLLTFDPLGHEKPEPVTLPHDRINPDLDQPRREVTVTLRFEYGNPTPERIAETLKKALEADRLCSDV